MADHAVLLTEAFDFSQDALDFKERLWKRLKSCTPDAIQALEDEDLEWISAAGMPDLEPKDDLIP